MHRFPAWLLAWTCLLSASPISAGVLTNATWVQTAILDSFPLSRTANDPRWAYFGSGTSTSLAVEIDYFPMSTIIGVPKTPNGPLDLGIQLTQGGAQIINATPGNAVATMGITGRQVVAGGLPIHLVKGIDQSMFRLGATTIVSIPVNVGVAGRLTNTFNAVGVNHTLTVNFYSWTPGSIKFTGLTSKGAPLSDVTAAGSWDWQGEAGMVNLVSPTKIDIDGPLAQRRTAAFTSLKLWFSEPGCCDADDDGIVDHLDVCPQIADPLQRDTDRNRVGDACNDSEDADGDEWADGLDVCPAVVDPSQSDVDANGLGDACNDVEDTDGDEWADALDVCPSVPDPAQSDLDGNGVGDACNDFEDPDGDDLSNELDNCPQAPNADQADLDRDLIGDVCDPQPQDRTNREALLELQGQLAECNLVAAEVARLRSELETTEDDLFFTRAALVAAVADADGDGVRDTADRCPETSAGAAIDLLGCSQHQFCGAIDAGAGGGRAVCMRSDWMNDEPKDSNPEDCKARRNGNRDVCLES
jgi:hypothetical protein